MIQSKYYPVFSTAQFSWSDESASAFGAVWTLVKNNVFLFEFYKFISTLNLREVERLFLNVRLEFSRTMLLHRHLTLRHFLDYTYDALFWYSLFSYCLLFVLWKNFAVSLVYRERSFDHLNYLYSLHQSSFVSIVTCYLKETVY